MPAVVRSEHGLVMLAVQRCLHDKCVSRAGQHADVRRPGANPHVFIIGTAPKGVRLC